MKKFLLYAMFLASASVFAQGTITGKVMDPEMDGPLPGANVMVVGTQQGAMTDFDGNFSLQVESSTGKIRISFVGYEPKTVQFNVPQGGTVDLGQILLNPDANALAEVVITSIADLAKDRQTPVAVSTIKMEEIQEKLGNQEFPEILSTTPSIYATKQGGGFGDARINIRGFDTQNSAVMINGVPVNDMENGLIFWSNWAGLSDVATAIQVQRGLGSSKLAVSSVGGTINVVTRSAERNEGGFISQGIGNDSYIKTIASYNTGLMDSGFSATALLSRTSGDGYVDGTEFEGYNYYFGLGFRPNDDHDFQFTVTGAPQWHHQRSFAPSIRDYIRYSDEAGEPDIKYNSDWGLRNGEEFNFRRNFYHKPIISLNWDWDINSVSKLSTSAYASFGRGGGTGEIGEINGQRQFQLPRSEDGLVRVDDIIAYNSGQLVPDFSDQPRERIDGLFLNNSDRNDNELNTNGITRRASINSHNWYGILANLSNELSETLTLDVGIDLRNYKGFHYRRVNDLLGGDAYQQTDDRNNPTDDDSQTNIFRETYDADQPWWVFADIDEEQKIDYYNIGYVNWAGVFGQLEYVGDEISAFVQGSLSNQGFAREELFGEVPPEKTDFENILGGNIKGGVNWNINENHNVFANAGYYSKQPLFDAVFINFSNTVNPDLTNETVIGTELGYGFRSSFLRANVNLYRTSWEDRFESVGATFNAGEPNEVRGTANLLGIKQVHTGIEVDAVARVTDQFKITGMLSIGNWEFDGDVEASFFDNDQAPILDENGNPETAILELDGVKVGDAAQFTASLGADYEIISGLDVDATYRFADNLYADFDATDAFGDTDFKALELPSFGLLDVGAGYRLDFTDTSLSFRVNVNNVTDKIYISEADTNRFASPGDPTYDGINTSNRVFFGWGRTWNLMLRYNF
ncbi:TonB-dependent receptor [Christiangramia sabulilitoris]|uniref:TonB-dependent receptor n=1 Tax=Christiangramia sabulilitoris TaxID=2583991 RepID=A0A550I8G1_9FLAO|nr:TonB-dependent receptor [Christiangramia sabulilitoris]TRO67254.1 TonB-dependent receptor [Christiangramia sabulilitoris]